MTIAKGVRLEVLDWGGNGPPLLFLSGWGNTAHVFDVLAPKFTGKHHVYGVTRRGFGLSTASAPTRENFNADRLGDDVLAAMTLLKLDRPVLIGHSVAGQELSSIGTRAPKSVAGLIYLDAAFSIAFYNVSGGNTAQLEIGTMREELEKLPKGYSESAEQLKKVLILIPILQRSLERDLATVEGLPEHKSSTYYDQVSDVMAESRRKYTNIKPPFLAIIASPRRCESDCDAPTTKAWAGELAAQADAVEADYPNARIIRIPNSDHYVFNSNEADVLREMNNFMDGLPH
jgi:pimeloyl-ACP methyl ester carboxylesterase